MDKQESTSFREQLLSQEKSDTQLREKFHLEIKKMYTEKLKISQRIAHVLICLLIAIFTLFFWAIKNVFEELQIKHELSSVEPLRLASMWAMYLSMALIALCLWPAIRGKIGLRFYPKVVRFVFWILILAVVMMIVATFSIWSSTEDSPLAGSAMQISGVLTLVVMVVVMGVYMLLSGRIDRGDMKNKIKTLELEYRIAELEEKPKEKMP